MYKRIVLKLSGEAAGSEKRGLSLTTASSGG